jgi:hypothetical protein
MSFALSLPIPLFQSLSPSHSHSLSSKFVTLPMDTVDE